MTADKRKVLTSSGRLVKEDTSEILMKIWVR